MLNLYAAMIDDRPTPVRLEQAVIGTRSAYPAVPSLTRSHGKDQ